jgi:hypothetical protein
MKGVLSLFLEIVTERTEQPSISFINFSLVLLVQMEFKRLHLDLRIFLKAFGISLKFII